MFDRILEEAVELRAKGEPFVLATVVAYRRPQSAKPGSRAIIRQDGTFIGWFGGGCVQPIVLKEAKKALAEKKPGLIIISPEGAYKDWQGVQEYLMACQGGGSLQIYLEPVFPRPDLVVFGQSPVAQTLAQLGKLLDFNVVAGGSPKEGSYVVVATMGDGDEEALLEVASCDAAYIGFVASREKSASLFEYLRGKGVADEKLKRIKCPAGMELGAESLPEIAFSVMAEILQLQKRNSKAVPGERPAMKLPILQAAPEAVDPICGMSVNTANARHTSVHQSKTYYFCCLRCKETFEQNPSQYVK